MNPLPATRRRLGLGRWPPALVLLLPSVLLLGWLVAGPAHAQQNRIAGDYGFTVVPAIRTLPADEESETTVVAFLESHDGAPIEGEEVRFVVRDGLGFLDSRRGGRSGGRSDDIAVEADDIGNGLYVARFRAGNVDGPTTVAAIWLSASQTPLPEATTTIDLMTARTLRVEVDDDSLLADGNDQATIVAYVADGLGRPLENADVTFRLVEGSGDLRVLGRSGALGRYAATFRPIGTSGRATVEVAVPDAASRLRERVAIGVLEAGQLEAIAFPERVAVRADGRRAEQQNIATVLVAVRDTDGELIRGLSSRELVAQVVAGPGEVTGGREIRLASGRGSGVYAFTFIASEITGESVVRVAQLREPNVNASVSIRSVTELGGGDIQQVLMAAFGDEPLYANEDEEVLIVAMAANRRGSAVSGLRPDFRIVSGQGGLEHRGEELQSSSGVRGSGIYLATLNTGIAGIDTVTEVRAIFETDDGDIRSGSLGIDLAAFEAPRVVIFPERIPADSDVSAVIDIYDFVGRDTPTVSGERYEIELEGGPGFLRDANNRGRFPDLIAGDNITSALFESRDVVGDQQEVVISVLDKAAPGYPVTTATLVIGQATEITVLAAPSSSERGERVEIVAFVSDEFGRPALDHELIITVEAGAAQPLAGGRMSDSGGSVAGFRDPYADDGMYVGAVEITGSGTRDIRIRVTDVTPPSQPTGDVRIRVGR